MKTWFKDGILLYIECVFCFVQSTATIAQMQLFVPNFAMLQMLQFDFKVQNFA